MASYLIMNRDKVNPMWIVLPHEFNGKKLNTEEELLKHYADLDVSITRLSLDGGKTKLKNCEEELK